MFLKNTILFFSFLFSSFLLSAQQFSTEKLSIATGVGVAEAKDALVYFPAGYSETKKYPLLLYTHGIGEAGSDVEKLYATGLPKVLKEGYRPSFDFIMVAVQSSSYSVAPAWLPSLLEESKKRWNIDTNRVYLTGISPAAGAPMVPSST